MNKEHLRSNPSTVPLLVLNYIELIERPNDFREQRDTDMHPIEIVC